MKNTLRAGMLALLLLAALLPPAARAGTEAELPAGIEAALAAPGLQRGITGICVQSLRDGRILYFHNSRALFMPASNMKIVTAALALDRLGPEYRFATRLSTPARVSQGTLHGDVYLQGFGDPTLTTAGLQEFVTTLRQCGIRKVQGSVVVDDSFFPGPRLGRGWSWDYLGDYYAMEVSALSLNENVVVLHARPGTAAGKPAILSWDPPARCIEVENRTKTGPAGSKQELSVSRALGSRRITVEGSIPLGAGSAALEPVTVDDPALYCGSVFAELLRQARIRVAGGVKHGAVPTGARVLCEHRSAPLSEVLPAFLKPSDNHYGEQIMRTVLAESAKTAGPGATPPSEQDLVGALLVKAGAPVDGMRPVDGSGLSRLDLISPDALVRLLRWTRAQPAGDLLYNALPVAGKDGTLLRRMRGTAAEGNAHAKTGTVNVVSCLSGYVTTAAGEPLAFSILMNHFMATPAEARAAQDRICVLLSELE